MAMVGLGYLLMPRGGREKMGWQSLPALWFDGRLFRCFFCLSFFLLCFRAGLVVTVFLFCFFTRRNG